MLAQVSTGVVGIDALTIELAVPAAVRW